MIAEFDKWCDMLFRAAMLVAGYHQHARGQWRKRRVKRVVVQPAKCRPRFDGGPQPRGQPVDSATGGRPSFAR